MKKAVGAENEAVGDFLKQPLCLFNSPMVTVFSVVFRIEQLLCTTSVEIFATCPLTKLVQNFIPLKRTSFLEGAFYV
jgi:hypothetical protein